MADLTTCKHSWVEPLNPVGPDVEAEEVLEAVEGPDSDLGEEVVGEVQLPQPDLTLELVPAETPEGVPSNRRRSVEVSRGQSRQVTELVTTWRSWCWPAAGNTWGRTRAWLSGCPRCPAAQCAGWGSGGRDWGNLLQHTGIISWPGRKVQTKKYRKWLTPDWKFLYCPEPLSNPSVAGNQWDVWEVTLARYQCEPFTALATLQRREKWTS